MALPAAKYLAVQGVVGVSQSTTRLPQADQEFIDAVRDQFPTVVARQAPPAEAPPNVPHLAMQSTTSQLAVSAVRADFHKRFYGDYVDDPDRCHEYLERKLGAVLNGWNATGAPPSFLGIILTLRFSFGTDSATKPIEHMLATLLRSEVDADDLQDAQARLGAKLDDKYFLTFHASTYEERVFERMVVPGLQVEVKPWEGRVDDRGIELTVDVNNRLKSVVEQEEGPLVAGEVEEMLALLRRAALGSAGRFVETGEFGVEALLKEEA